MQKTRLIAFVLTSLLFTAVSIKGQCGAPERVENAAFEPFEPSGSYPVDTSITYTCSPGYAGSGNNRRTCQSNNTWTDIDFQCQILTCPVLNVPSNGNLNLSDENNFGSIATFTCNTGFTLTGDARRVCAIPSDGSNVEWTGMEVSCSPVRCDDLALPSGVVVTDGSSPPYVFNSRVTLGCSDSSLVLSNPALSPTICDADGNWSTFPTCVVSYDCSFNAVGDFCGYTNTGWQRAITSSPINSILQVPVARSGFGASSLVSDSFTVPQTGACLSFYLRIDSNNANNFEVQVTPTGSSPRTVFSRKNAAAWEMIRLDLDPNSGEIQWSFAVATSTRNIFLEDITLVRTTCDGTPATTMSTDSVTATTSDASATVSSTIPGISTTGGTCTIQPNFGLLLLFVLLSYIFA